MISFEIGTRPCGGVDRDGADCPHLVDAKAGYRSCPGGHLSFSNGLHTPNSEHVSAQAVWSAQDLRANCTRQLRATHRPDGTIEMSSRKARTRTDLKYGIEALEDRVVTYTRHARAQMEFEGISEADVRSVLVDGVIHQRQPGKFRYRGMVDDGRAIHIVFRFNVRHEAVVIAAFSEPPLLDPLGFLDGALSQPSLDIELLTRLA